jgi:DNA-binding PadR family transcriptional regulator
LSIKHAILGLLVGGPLHGYGLKAAYEEQLVPGASLNIGQVYPALDRLQQDGLVSVEVVSQSERPDRKVYTLTEAGRHELQAWLQSPSRPEVDLRHETYLKVMLAYRLAREAPGSVDLLGVIDAERHIYLERLHELTLARARAEKEQTQLPTLLLLDLAILRLGAFHQWLEHCEELFRLGPGAGAGGQ